MFMKSRVGVLRVSLFLYAKVLLFARLLFLCMENAVLSLSLGLFTAGESSSATGVAAQRWPFGLAQSDVCCILRARVQALLFHN